MPLLDLYREIHWLASRYAHRPDVIQGAGGNVSAKVTENEMLIKASGKEFSEIGLHGENLVRVAYADLRNCLLGAPPENAGAVAQSHVLVSGSDQPLRPSMEVWFHTLLPKFVLHTHSVYVNVLGCAHGGSALLADCMQKAGISALVLPYYNPGFELGNVLATYSATQPIPPVILLENHGIVVSGDTAQVCAELHDRVEQAIRTAFNLSTPASSDEVLNEEEMLEFIRDSLFPDQIVYPELPTIRAAHRFIVRNIKRHGLSVRAIPDEQVALVAGMESELYRKRMRTAQL